MKSVDKKEKIRTIILAAGKGTRMKSDLAKVLHHLCGKPMLSYVVETAKLVNSEEIIVIVGHQARTVEERFREQDLIFIEQQQQLGTGHAVLQARKRLENYCGPILILCGDVPLLKPVTVRSFINRHVATEASVTVMTTNLSDPTGYGRIVKGPGGEISRIIEERDATEEEKKINEINTGIYCAERKFLFDALMSLDNNNNQKEYYLTDIIHIAYNNRFKAGSMVVRDHREVMGINTQDDLERACLFLGDRF
jgi:UDP-N-acetylglucosamine diphosphorylase/glucosamine-1-phosphate N-acetyltransferase